MKIAVLIADNLHLDNSYRVLPKIIITFTKESLSCQTYLTLVMCNIPILLLIRDNLDLSYRLSISILQWLASIFTVSAIFTTIIAWKINILSYISKFMAYSVQALQSISLVHVQKVCLPVLLTLLSS